MKRRVFAVLAVPALALRTTQTPSSRRVTAGGGKGANERERKSAMLKRFLGSAGLAIAAVTVALSAVPAPAQAQSGSSFCVDFDGVIVGPGELVRRVDGSDPRRVYTRTYLCRDDGRLVFLYEYCEGPDCWPWEQRKPPILAFEPVLS